MNESVEVAARIAEDRPDEAARVLERLPSGEAARFVAALSHRVAGALLTHMHVHQSARCIQVISADHAAAVLGHTQLQTIAAILRHLGQEHRDAILSRLPARMGGRLSRLLYFPADTAGANADPDVLTLPPDMSAADVLEQLTTQPSDVVHVVERDERLVGAVTTDRLLSARRDSTLDMLVQPAIDAMPADLPLRAAHGHEGWAYARTLPVADQHGIFVGGLRYGVMTQTLRTITQPAGLGVVENALLPLAEAYWSALAGVTHLVLALLASPSSRRPSHER